MEDFARKDPNNLLVQQPGGKFVEMGDKAGIASMNVSRGAALADFNMDGLVDLAVVNRWVNAELYRNTTADAGTFVAFKPVSDGANRDAIGAWIEVKCGADIMRREITSGGGHVSGTLTWQHFGIGTEKNAEVRLIWPDGTAGEWQKVDAGKFYLIDKAKGVSEWQ
jgi:hypothetical protein